MVISVDGVIGGGVWPRLMRMPDGPPVDGRAGAVDSMSLIAFFSWATSMVT
jgi:hypothetical protein